ncbi:expressed unknown protein [Seminavis robusta]|uniref:Uncharacterized protein n=1 Tax=Seminavis robusta TaxID=568900 RepID=A0A9N8HIV7_9STRA|nr:expressed unknown protein [Seminavis robusta]|eukprot:Sro649_g181200.1 n/a (276) ;mRNA; f:25432-26356
MDPESRKSSNNSSSIGSGAPTAPGTVTGASALLASGLTTSLMAEEVVSFLDRTSVLSCMEVTQAENQFQLTNYYCSDHGSKLECQKGLREEIIPKKFPWLKKQKESNDAGNEPKKKLKKIDCEDCVNLEHGLDRCPCCEEFSEQKWMVTCQKPGCGKKACDTCLEYDLVVIEYCDDCREWACKDCVPLDYYYCDIANTVSVPPVEILSTALVAVSFVVILEKEQQQQQTGWAPWIGLISLTKFTLGGKGQTRNFATEATQSIGFTALTFRSTKLR